MFEIQNFIFSIVLNSKLLWIYILFYFCFKFLTISLWNSKLCPFMFKIFNCFHVHEILNNIISQMIVHHLFFLFPSCRSACCKHLASNQLSSLMDLHPSTCSTRPADSSVGWHQNVAAMLMMTVTVCLKRRVLGSWHDSLLWRVQKNI